MIVHASRLWSGQRAGWVFILPALVVLFVTVAFPVLYTVALSLTTWSASATQPPRWVGTSNYVRIVGGDEDFRRALATSARYSGAAVTLEVVAGVALAHFLNRPFAGKWLVQTVLLLPVAGTPAAFSLVWRHMYNPSYGVLNWLLGIAGLQAQRWLSDPGTALLSLVLFDVWQWTPFITLIVLAAMAALPIEPYEAAVIDGASPWQLFWRVTLPLVWPAIMAAATLRLIDSLKTFDQIFITTQGGPGTATQTLTLYVFDQAFRYLNFGYASALLVALFALIVVSNLALIRWRRIAQVAGGV